jgi:hypothetical protein
MIFDSVANPFSLLEVESAIIASIPPNHTSICTCTLLPATEVINLGHALSDIAVAGSFFAVQYWKLI